jgi:hypothetical protein
MLGRAEKQQSATGSYRVRRWVRLLPKPDARDRHAACSGRRLGRSRVVRENSGGPSRNRLGTWSSDHVPRVAPGGSTNNKAMARAIPLLDRYQPGLVAHSMGHRPGAVEGQPRMTEFSTRRKAFARCLRVLPSLNGGGSETGMLVVVRRLGYRPPPRGSSFRLNSGADGCGAGLLRARVGVAIGSGQGGAG